MISFGLEWAYLKTGYKFTGQTCEVSLANLYPDDMKRVSGLCQALTSEGAPYLLQTGLDGF